MSEDAVIIEIDDSQLDVALIKLDLLGQMATKTIGRGKKLESSLPSINRELRLILGQAPGMRNLIQMLFRAKRLERGLLLKKLGEGSTQLYLTLIATAIVLIRTIQRHERRVEAAEKRFEMMVRRAKGWTHEEFVKGTNEWENYLKGLPP